MVINSLTRVLKSIRMKQNSNENLKCYIPEKLGKNEFVWQLFDISKCKDLNCKDLRESEHVEDAYICERYGLAKSAKKVVKRVKLKKRPFYDLTLRYVRGSAGEFKGKTKTLFETIISNKNIKVRDIMKSLDVPEPFRGDNRIYLSYVQRLLNLERKGYIKSDREYRNKN